MLVFDPSNYSQNLLTAARALQQIENQIKSLQYEARMLINQAKHLEQLPISVLNDVERDYAQIQNLLSFSALGLKAVGSGLSASEFLHPGRIAQVGLDAASPSSKPPAS